MRSIVIPLHRSCGASNDESTRQSHGHSVNQAEPRQFSQSDRASANNQPISLISQSHDQSVKQPSSQAHRATVNQPISQSGSATAIQPISQSHGQSARATEPRPMSFYRYRKFRRLSVCLSAHLPYRRETCVPVQVSSLLLLANSY